MYAATESQASPLTEPSAPAGPSAPAKPSAPTTRTRLALASNLFLVVFTIVAWVMMFFGWANPDAQLFTSKGLENMKYFTVLSNLFSGIVSAIYAVALIRQLRGGAGPSRPVFVLKFMATTAVALTFTVVVVMFAPALGFRPMYLGANFWFHGVLPLVAMLEFCFLDEGPQLHARSAGWTLIPTLLYGAGYYANLLINGLGGEWPNTNDFYGFAAWGMDKAPLVFAIMLLVTLVLALVLWSIYRLRCRYSCRQRSRCS